MVERERLHRCSGGRLSQYVMVSRYERPELLFMLQTPGTPASGLDQVKKSDGRHNYNNLQMAGRTATTCATRSRWCARFRPAT